MMDKKNYENARDVLIDVGFFLLVVASLVTAVTNVILVFAKRA